GPTYVGVRGTLTVENGDLLVEGNWAGTATGNFAGVVVGNLGHMGVASGGTANVTVRGKGGDTGLGNSGVVVTGGTLEGGTAGTLHVTGVAGAGDNSSGVVVSNLTGKIRAFGADIELNGTGDPAGSGNFGTHGIYVSTLVETVGSGDIVLTGTASTSSSPNQYGIEMAGIVKSAGDLTVTGVGSPAGSPDIYATQVFSGVAFEAQGLITVNAQAHGMWPSDYNGKVTLKHTGSQQSVFGAASKLVYHANGASPFQQSELVVEGPIDLNGVELVPLGYVPQAGDVLLVVDNRSSQAVTGHLTMGGVSLGQGDPIPNFMNSGLTFYINYLGGDGNDVVITSSPPPVPDYVVTQQGTSITITDMAGNGEQLSISDQGGTHIRFDAAGRTYSLNGAAVVNLPVDLPLAGMSAIEVNAGNGADTVRFLTDMANLPSLTVNGDAGDDLVQVLGVVVTLQSGADLDLDLTDDAASGDFDRLLVAQTAASQPGKLMVQGYGDATVRTSGPVEVGTGGRLSAMHGNLVVEGNWAGTSTGQFSGVKIGAQAFLGIENNGMGALTVRGRGGNQATDNHGVHVSSGVLCGGSGASALIEGTGGTGNNSTGVYVADIFGIIQTNGGHLQIDAVGD
ncbi:MAG: hypothetical protein D6818_04190, partial [Bacteroidetes bacterium]